MAKQKIILQRAALKHGLPFFLRQAVTSIRDQIWSQRHLIFVISASDGPRPLANSRFPNPTFRVVASPSGFPAQMREVLEATQAELGWGKFDWFDFGWKAYMLEIDGKLAALTWWASHEQMGDFYYQIPEGSIFLLQTTVFPEYRGGRLLDTILNNCIQHHIDRGIDQIYGSCRDFNFTSSNMLKRNGWQYLGYAEVNNFTRANKFRRAKTA